MYLHGSGLPLRMESGQVGGLLQGPGEGRELLGFEMWKEGREEVAFG